MFSVVSPEKFLPYPLCIPKLSVKLGQMDLRLFIAAPLQISYPFAFKIGFLDIGWINVLDILLVTILLFNLYKLLKGSGALKIFIGFLFLYLVYLVVKASEMELLGEILGQFMNVGVLAAIILFQQEIRKFLLLIGKSAEFRDITGLRFFKRGNKKDEPELNINGIVDAMKAMGASNTGGLIVVSRADDLRFYAETGDYLNAEISKRLLLSIFFKNSPLHDGAVIIYKNRILAARCILPVSENKSIPASMGLRHRAGIGITEVTDSAVLVVSEETGQLSYVFGGVIQHNLSPLEIRRVLREYLMGEHTVPAERKQEDQTAAGHN